MFKGAITTATAAVANTNIPFTVAYNTNNNTAYDATNNIVNITKPGFYDVTANLVVTGVAAGNISAQLYANGVAIPEAVASGTSGAVTDVITLPIDDMFRVISSNLTAFGNLSVRLSAAATINSAVFIVEKVR